MARGMTQVETVLVWGRDRETPEGVRRAVVSRLPKGAELVGYAEVSEQPANRAHYTTYILRYRYPAEE